MQTKARLDQSLSTSCELLTIPERERAVLPRHFFLGQFTKKGEERQLGKMIKRTSGHWIA